MWLKNIYIYKWKIVIVLHLKYYEKQVENFETSLQTVAQNITKHDFNIA